MSTECYVGIDGGGTRARAVVVDEAGHELARREGPSALVDPTRPDRVARVVAQLTREVLHAAGAQHAAALCCGLAGAGRDQERAAVHGALTREHVAARVLVIGDAEAAMADAFPTGTGVLLVAGTGSIAWGRHTDGTSCRVGGWGRILGDEGSGYDIAVLALRSVARAADGRAPATSLTAALLLATGAPTPDALVPWAAAATKAQIAALAPVVLRSAADGDATATGIRDEAARALCDLATAAVRAIAAPTPSIALTGGLIGPGGPLRDAVLAVLARLLPEVAISGHVVDAARGAAWLARQT